MLNIPIGTVVGALQLAWLLKPGARTLFSGRRPRDLSDDELDEANSAARETGIVTGAAVTGLLVVGCAGAGILAAIALPSLLFARVGANEAAALADVRSVVAAQASYQSANGHYDRIECLNVPSACIPGYPSTEAPFLPGTFVTNPERNGYRFHLEPGPSPPNLSIARSSASSLERYAYLAIPSEFRTTGRRVFCGDDTGRVCAFTDLGATRTSGGRCAPGCVDVVAR
jgi:type II secretory pathway pseudopilin PulG